VAPPLEAPLMEAPPQILILKSEPLQGGVLFGGLKTINPRQEVNLVVIHIYFFRITLIIFTLAYLLFCISIALEKKRKIFITFIIAS
jgi:cytochrome bd-type quinol oxidase subunit 1